MRIVPRASTNVGYFLDKDDAIEFSGKCAKVCYERTTIDDVFSEKGEKARDRALGCIASGQGRPMTWNLRARCRMGSSGWGNALRQCCAYCR